MIKKEGDEMKTKSIFKSDKGKALIIDHYDNLIKKMASGQRNH